MNLSTFIVIVIIVVIGVFATRHMLAAFKGDGACHGGGDAKKVKAVKVEDTDESHYPYAEDLKVGGMTCANCVNAVEGAVNSLEGTWCRVDLESGVAHILSKSPIEREAVNAAVRDAGYYLVKTV